MHKQAECSTAKVLVLKAEQRVVGVW